MLPSRHIALGLIFALALMLSVPGMGWIGFWLVFLASFLIDFDHYITYVKATKRHGLPGAYKYYFAQEEKVKIELKRGIKKKGDFHFFHTIEFHFLVFLLGFLWIGFWYILIGMIFHSLLDVLDMTFKKRLFRREFFFVNWLRKKFK